MAYRFTDTEKWNDAWFSELIPLSKLLFLYLCDQCDIAGFLEINIRKICFDLGIRKLEAEKSLKDVETRLIYSKDKRFVFVINFLKHQKNLKLNPANNAHRGIIKRLEENLSLFDLKDINQFIFSLPGASPKPLVRGTGNGNGNGNGNEGDIGGMGEKEKTWREDFDVYMKEVTKAYDELVSDVEFLRERERYHPNIDIRLSLEKSFKDFWGTEAGWRNKKKSRSVNLDWERTFNNSLSQKINQVYKSRNDLFSKPPSVATTPDNRPRDREGNLLQ